MKKYLMLVLTLVSVLTACDNGASAPQEELVRVRLGVVSDTRSVLPTVPDLEGMDWFELRGTALDREESWLADFVYQNSVFYDRYDEAKKNPAVVYLRPGVWHFTLYAYPSGDNVPAALKGTATVTIMEGFDETINFTLSPYSEEDGVGSVSLRIDLPKGSDVASVETTIDGGPLDPALDIDEGAIIYEDDEATAGEYLFSFALKDSAGKTVAVVSDIVVVASGLKSEKKYALTDDDLNGPPTAPSALAVTSYDEQDQTFHFTWQDNSFNETGFRLSDGNTTRTIDAATQSFDFPVPDPTASATYTLSAVNSFGESTPAQINGPIVFTVTFNADNGDAEAQTLQATAGVGFGVSMPAPTRTDYTFDGWYTAQNGGGSAFTADTIVTRDLTVYAKWIEGVVYELTKNPVYDNYKYDADNFLAEGFTVDAGDQITVSFSIKTDTALTGFYVGIGDWNNDDYYNSGDDGWIAPGWHDTKSVPADGQFHSYEWTLTATANAPAGDKPLLFHFAIDSVHKDKVTILVKEASVTKRPGLSPNLSLNDSLTWIANNAEEGGNYTITLKNNDSIAPRPLSYEGKNVSVTLNGGDAERTISLTTTGILFTIGSGVTLTLGNNVTLQGLSDNTHELMLVNSGGTLVMENGSKINGNNKTTSSSFGGGVYVNGTFTMNGGTISGNTSSDAGGGVSVNIGTFTQSGGTISGNSATYGGGVNNDGTFTQSGGTISDNSASLSGGGVYNGGTFTQSGGTISNNTATYGGGTFANNDGTFTITDGTTSGNTSAYGGGVYVYNGTFTKSGGTIYGSNAEDGFKNTATSGDSYGHAVYINSSPAEIRNITAGSGVTLDSAVSGPAGGWLASINNITYSSVSGGGTWTLESDGRRKSPYIGHDGITKARISFTSTAGASITIQLDVSSELTYDRAFISTLDNSSATYDSGYFTGSLISGENSVTITIPISTAGDHFIDIGYQKDYMSIGGSDRAWFKVVQ
jgi:uncharacterized repeat protein (TIGR02543 family)